MHVVYRNQLGTFCKIYGVSSKFV